MGKKQFTCPMWLTIVIFVGAVFWLVTSFALTNIMIEAAKNGGEWITTVVDPATAQYIREMSADQLVAFLESSRLLIFLAVGFTVACAMIVIPFVFGMSAYFVLFLLSGIRSKVQTQS